MVVCRSLRAPLIGHRQGRPPQQPNQQRTPESPQTTGQPQRSDKAQTSNFCGAPDARGECSAGHSRVACSGRIAPAKNQVGNSSNPGSSMGRREQVEYSSNITAPFPLGASHKQACPSTAPEQEIMGRSPDASAICNRAHCSERETVDQCTRQVLCSRYGSRSASPACTQKCR